MSRHSGSGITNFLSDIVDDIKDFLDDEIIDRGRDTERDLRRASRNWTDSDSGSERRRGSRRRGSRRRAGQASSGAGNEDLDQLREAVQALSKKVDSLAKK